MVIKLSNGDRRSAACARRVWRPRDPGRWAARGARRVGEKRSPPGRRGGARQFIALVRIWRAPPRDDPGGDLFSPAHGALRAPPGAQDLEGAARGERSPRTVYHHYFNK